MAFLPTILGCVIWVWTNKKVSNLTKVLTFLTYTIFGALEEIRTPDPLVRSQVLYPTELRARKARIIQ